MGRSLATHGNLCKATCAQCVRQLDIDRLDIENLTKQQMRRAIVLVQAYDVVDWDDLRLISPACLPCVPVH